MRDAVLYSGRHFRDQLYDVQYLFIRTLESGRIFRDEEMERLEWRILCVSLCYWVENKTVIMVLFCLHSLWLLVSFFLVIFRKTIVVALTTVVWNVCTWRRMCL